MNITAHSSEKQFLDYIGQKSIDQSMQLAEIWSNQENDVVKDGKLVLLKTGSDNYEYRSYNNKGCRMACFKQWNKSVWYR